MKADRDESSPYAAMLAAQDVAQRCKVSSAASTLTSDEVHRHTHTHIDTGGDVTGRAENWVRALVVYTNTCVLEIRACSARCMMGQQHQHAPQHAS